MKKDIQIKLEREKQMVTQNDRALLPKETPHERNALPGLRGIVAIRLSPQSVI